VIDRLLGEDATDRQPGMARADDDRRDALDADPASPEKLA
jgi:hypothetical protein